MIGPGRGLEEWQEEESGAGCRDGHERPGVVEVALGRERAAGRERDERGEAPPGITPCRRRTSSLSRIAVRPVTKREIRPPKKLRSCTGDESVAERRPRVENAAPAARPHDQAGAT
jgi:hypothetical protein